MRRWSPSHSSSSPVDATSFDETQASANYLCSWYVLPSRFQTRLSLALCDLEAGKEETKGAGFGRKRRLTGLALLGFDARFPNQNQYAYLSSWDLSTLKLT